MEQNPYQSPDSDPTERRTKSRRRKWESPWLSAFVAFDIAFILWVVAVGAQGTRIVSPAANGLAIAATLLFLWCLMRLFAGKLF